MIASVLRLSRADVMALRITDPYSLHRVVYDLFEDIRDDNEKKGSVSSGILYADKGGDFNTRQILILSNRMPHEPEYGEVDTREIPPNFLDYPHYSFEVIVNPTKRDRKSRKLVAVRGDDMIREWFVRRALGSWGFSVNVPSLQINNINVKQFEKKGNLVTLGSATLIGNLSVNNRETFSKSFREGIGRGHAFGFGLLQIVPHSNSLNF